jgi:hypothetical protein
MVSKDHTRRAIIKLQMILKSELLRETKIKVFYSQPLVESVLIYGAETRTITIQLERSLDGCYIGLFRAALNITWTQKEANADDTTLFQPVTTLEDLVYFQSDIDSIYMLGFVSITFLPIPLRRKHFCEEEPFSRSQFH